MNDAYVSKQQHHKTPKHYDDDVLLAVDGLPRRETALDCSLHAFEPLKYSFAQPFSIKTPTTRQRENQNSVRK